jgi:RNA polymerase sigma-70 factor (ECF subfamily)
MTAEERRTDQAGTGVEARLNELMLLRDRAYALAVRTLGAEALAEDAVQEACLRAVRALRAGAAPVSLKAWFLTAVVRASLELARSETSRRKREAATMKSAVSSTSSAAAAASAGLAAALSGCLAALDEKHRLPIVLCYEHGLTQAEIAAALGLPVGTVATNIARGMEKLHAALSRAGFAVAAGMLAEALGSTPGPCAPAALTAKLEAIVSGKGALAAVPAAHSVAAGTIEGGIIMKIGMGVVAAGLLAGGVFVAAGGLSEEPTSPPSKVPGKDYPYGEGVVYRRQVAAIGSLTNGGYQDGPGPQMELTGDVCRAMAPNGDWYFMDQEMNCVIVKYDARKKRSYTIAWGGPYGKLGGAAECARFAGGGYGTSMGLGVSDGGKSLIIHDRSNNGYRWKLDLEKMTVEPTSGAEAIKGAVVSGGAPDGSIYFAMGDGKLKKLAPDGKTVQDLGVTLEPPLQMSSYFGSLLVNEKAGRLYAGSRDPYSPWGVFWYWDMKTGKATGLCGPKTIGGESGKRVAQDGGEVDKNYHCASGPASKVSFWCCGGPSYGPDRGERYLYIPGGDESTCSRLDLEKMYVTKMVKADPKGDRSLWTFGEGKQGKDYRFADPYCWAGSPIWGPNGEYYMTWALCSAIDVYTPVQK